MGSSVMDGGWASVGCSGLGRVHPSLVGGPMVRLRDRVGEAVSWVRFKFREGREERDGDVGSWN